MSTPTLSLVLPLSLTGDWATTARQAAELSAAEDIVKAHGSAFEYLPYGGGDPEPEYRDQIASFDLATGVTVVRELIAAGIEPASVEIAGLGDGFDSNPVVADLEARVNCDVINADEIGGGN